MMHHMGRTILTMEESSIQMETCHTNVSATNPTDRLHVLLPQTKITEVVKKVNQSHYSPGVTQRVPGS